MAHSLPAPLPHVSHARTRVCGLRAPGDEAGFTVIELLVVLVIVAVLMAATVMAYNSSKSSARTNAVRAAAQSYKEAVEAFRLDHGARSPAMQATYNHTTDWPTSAAQITKGPLNASQAASYTQPGKPYHPEIPQVVAQGNAQLLTSTAAPSTGLPVEMAIGYAKTGANTYTIVGWSRKSRSSAWVNVCTLGVGVTEKC